MSSIESKKLAWPSTPSKIVVVGFGVFFTVAMFVIVASQWRQAAANRVIPITDFSAALKHHGVEGLAPLETPGALPVAAQQTFEISVDGKPVWILYFDPFDSRQAAARNQLKKAGSLDAKEARQACKVTGDVAIVGYQDHPAEKQVLAAFDEFATPKPNP